MSPQFSAVPRWLAAAAVATLAAFALTYRSIDQSEASNRLVDHTQRTLSALIALEGAAGDLIFASTDDSIKRAADNVFRNLDDLKALTLDDPRQQERLVRLRVEFERIVETRRASDTGVATRAEATVPQSLSRLLRDVRTEELALLTTRVEANNVASQRLRGILVVVAAGSGLLLLWVFRLVSREARNRHEVEAMLRRSNDELDRRVAARTTELNEAVEREQELRRQAEAHSRLKDEFLMTVSHELRTPLNALLGWADMLRLGVVSGDRRQRAAEAIYENAKLQKQLIGDLLDTARILTGKLRIESQVVDLAEIVRDAVSVVTPAAQAKGLSLDVRIDPHTGTFVGDGARLQQIVWNLVSNAVKFTPQGTVTVEAAPDDAVGNMKIVVSDTGQGVSPAFLPYVFDRFRQEQTGTTRRHGGLGLGLAIVRELVELHGGTIRVESRGEGHGAVFTVTLPVRRKDAASTAARDGLALDSAAHDDVMPALDGVRVLVVDDDSSAREMVAVALGHCGARIATVASVDEARHALAENPWDVFLIDIAMPGEDGYALMREIRTRGLRQPAAALTAQVRETDRARAFEAGFNAHIPKPIEAHHLAQAVATLIGDARNAVN